MADTRPAGAAFDIDGDACPIWFPDSILLLAGGHKDRTLDRFRPQASNSGGRREVAARGRHPHALGRLRMSVHQASDWGQHPLAMRSGFND